MTPEFQSRKQNNTSFDVLLWGMSLFPTKLFFHLKKKKEGKSSQISNVLRHIGKQDLCPTQIVYWQN